ncbi:uncharacterized protein LOC135168076 isoform X2 [Diachasmimorpha longicaudata]|uniref:uncharacterized protein LOC135168076 isoform X2 n=1 Tax=Diachasmimorpha longicaudata TaxID=58733 RepID=UPI0030B8FE0D
MKERYWLLNTILEDKNVRSDDICHTDEEKELDPRALRKLDFLLASPDVFTGEIEISHPEYYTKSDYSGSARSQDLKCRVDPDRCSQTQSYKFSKSSVKGRFLIHPRGEM